MSDDLAIHDATVLVHAEGGEVEFVEHHDVLIAGGRVRAVVPSGPTAPDAGEVIPGRGMLAMPGFINGHAHSPMVMFRGAAEDVDEERWFNEFIWPMETNLTADDVELAARLAAAEMIRAGVTTFADHYFHMDRIARVVDETGMRGVLGDTYFSSDGPAGLERGLAFASEWAGAADGRITTALAPHAPYTVSDDDLRATAEAAQERDLLVHIHAGESRIQTRHSLSRRGSTPIGVLELTGLLEARVLIAHGIGIVPDDLAALGRARAVGIASAPKGYLKHGPDTTPVRMLRTAGVPVGLATDGAASNNTVDVWESMTYLALTQKAVERDQMFMTARQALHHATLQSAVVVGLAGVVGSIAPGHQADIVLVDLSSPRLQPVHDLASTLVYSGRSDDIDTTIVAGRVLMRGRRLLTIDLDAVLAELIPRLRRLTDRSHGLSIQSYEA
jgi:5-methylthioadenosine/S-adenosylhomocysteine deaminase